MSSLENRQGGEKASATDQGREPSLIKVLRVTGESNKLLTLHHTSAPGSIAHAEGWMLQPAGIEREVPHLTAGR